MTFSTRRNLAALLSSGVLVGLFSKPAQAGGDGIARLIAVAQQKADEANSANDAALQGANKARDSKGQATANALDGVIKQLTVQGQRNADLRRVLDKLAIQIGQGCK